jgi:hypothetical protein
MPGMAGASSSSSSSSGGGGGGFGAARSVAESVAAAARAKAGEGEEFIVAEMLDMDEDFGYDGNGGGGKRSVLDGPSRSRFDGMPSLFDDEKTNDDHGGGGRADREGISDAFVYDSDSSAEERMARRGGGRKDAGSGGLPPTQLPFPGAPHRPAMYECQEYDGNNDDGEEKKTPDRDATSSSSVRVAAACASSSKLDDPPLQSPFLDLASVSDALHNQADTRNSWFLMKFPTRLPHLDASSASSSASKKRAARIKSELFDGFDNNAPDVAGSSGPHADAIASSGEAGAPALATASSGAPGYDDTLKDSAAGRYGRIVVRKSGKTELIIGGGGDGHEVRKVRHAYPSLSSRVSLSEAFTLCLCCFFSLKGSSARPRGTAMRFQTGGGVHRSRRCNLCVVGVGGQIARRDAGHRTCIRGFVTEEFERILRHEHGDPLCRLFLEWLESNSRSRRVLNSCDESAKYCSMRTE